MKKTVFTAPMAALLLLSCAQAPQEKGKEITYTPQAPYNPPTYVCYKAPAPIKIDGKMSPEEWDAIPWTTDFVDIEGDKRPKPLLQLFDYPVVGVDAMLPNGKDIKFELYPEYQIGRASCRERV